MIAKLDIKGCPFRKKILETNPGGRGTEEFFLECKEGECMAWDQKARDCRLMMRDTKEEKK